MTGVQTCALPILSASLIAAAPASQASTPSTIYTTGFDTPAGIALDSAGNLYVADYHANTITKVVSTYGVPTLTTIGSGFLYPLGVAVDSANNVYVADYGHSRVEKIAADGTTQSDVSSGFTNPTGVATGPSGDIYVSDTTAVVHVSADGSKTTVATGFTNAQGIARDQVGNLFVTDKKDGAGYVARIDHITHSVSTIATGFRGPVGIALDPSGDVLVADQYANTIDRISTGGISNIVMSDPIAPMGVAVTDVGRIVTGSLRDFQTPKTGKILVAPAQASAPSIAMAALPAVSQTKQLNVSWTSSALATMATVDVRYRSASSGAPLPSTYKTLVAGSREFNASLAGNTDTRYCFSAMSHTSIGATSSWSAESCTTIPIDDRGLVRSKAAAWTSTSDIGWLASTASMSTVKGSSLTTTKVRTVKSLSVLGLTCPTCGSLDVYVGSTKVGSISLKASTSRRVLLNPIRLPKVKTGKVSLVVASTGKWVKIDGVVIS